MPDYCPLCGERIGHDRDDDDVVAPFIRHTTTKATDQVYRDIEQASERRAELAAEMAGTSVEEMSGLKITNLRDQRHAGDVAAVPVVNDITRFMDDNPKLSGFTGGAGGQGVQYSGAVQAGPYPNVGARMRTAIQNIHLGVVAKEVPGGSTDVTSERHALETYQPGYRTRG
jgi:hypothetical protein